ncbi:hypothetical protein O181_004022 [Austropuccinia psidii MF-1]|uniref:Uncharacterized protein n=1 Tax=Austropuccinia psidii MF-1 TaxID=1389203 RepID=A0A9Q3GFE1_9BASI|nr:hypothetical protein [Austropuccinia psidii MF-1]
MTETNLPKHKRYNWVPQKDISASNEIVGDIGDPCKNIPGPRTRNHCANYAGPIDSSPKTYEQAISGPGGEKWAEVVRWNYKTWSNMRCGSQMHHHFTQTLTNHMGV